MLIPRYREGERVIPPVVRERVEATRPSDSHLVPQAGARQRRQEQGVEIIQAISAGGFGDELADSRLIGVQADDKGPHHQDSVPLYPPHRSAEVAALLKIELLSEFPEPLRRGSTRSR